MGTGSVVNFPVDLLAVLVTPVDAITSSVDATCDMAVRFGALRYEGDNDYVNQIVSAMVGCSFSFPFFLGRRSSSVCLSNIETGFGKYLACVLFFSNPLLTNLLTVGDRNALRSEDNIYY
jgi:hypothetical protein